MPAEAMQSALQGYVAHAFLMEFRRTKRSVWFQARRQMDTQNAPGINQTHFFYCVFCDASTIYLRESWSAAVSAKTFYFHPSLLAMTDFVTIKSNQYLISNIVLSLPVSFWKA